MNRDEISQSIDNLTLAVLLLTKMIVKKGRIHLTEEDKIAFAQISPKEVKALYSIMNDENFDR